MKSVALKLEVLMSDEKSFLNSQQSFIYTSFLILGPKTTPIPSQTILSITQYNYQASYVKISDSKVRCTAACGGSAGADSDQ